MKLIKVYLLIIFFIGVVDISATANPDRVTVNLTGDPYTDFASDEYLGSRNSLEVWITWNSSTIWVAWRGGTTNQPTDKYYFAIDINPGTSNGTTNVYGGLQWTGVTQNGLNKPDYVYHWENISAPTEYLATGDALTGWSTVTTDVTDFIVGGSPGIVEAGIPWSYLGGSFPSSFSFWFWTNNSSETYVWSAFPTDIPIGSGTQTANSKLFVANTSGNVSPNTLVSSPLPVELSSFTASVLNNTVLLKWRTETEVNNYGFEIERKTGSRQSAVGEWEQIAFIEGFGNSNSPKEYSFEDNLSLTRTLNLTPALYYRLRQIDNDGSFNYSNVVEVFIGEIPDGFLLEQNYPNPFNPSTKIRFAVDKSVHTALKVYDALGKHIVTLFDALADAGRIYEVEFSTKGGSSIGGNVLDLQSGVYYYHLVAGENQSTKKMILLH